jgi:hypothetical protein
MAWNLSGTYFESCSCEVICASERDLPVGPEVTIAHSTHARVNAFGIEYAGTSGFSASKFAWAA